MTSDPPPARSARGRLTWRRRMLLLAGGLAIGLFLAEGLLWGVGFNNPQPYLADPHIGARLQPHFRSWFTLEGRAWVTVNSEGFRDREHSVSKPPGTFRIAVLGDSFIEALQTPLPDACFSVLERELADCPAFESVQIEVLSFGVSGFGTGQQLLTYRHYARKYRPDLVLLAFFTGNDVRNNSRELEPDAIRPYFVLHEDELQLDDSFREHPDFVRSQSAWVRGKVWAINHSRILQFVQYLRNRRSAPGSQGEEAVEAGLDAAAFTPPSDPRWQRAWETTERILLRLRDEVEADGAQFRLVTLTQGVQVHPDPAYRRRAADALRTADLDYPDRRLAEFARRHGMSCITLLNPLRRLAEERQVFLHGFPNTRPGVGHWNVEGHRAAGELLARRLCEDPQLPAPQRTAQP